MSQKNLVIIALVLAILYLLFARKSSGYRSDDDVGGFNLGNVLYGSTAAAQASGTGSATGSGPMALQGSFALRGAQFA